MSTLNWGIIGTGMISEWVINDLLFPDQTHNKHVITNIGSSSESKGLEFVKQFEFDGKDSKNHGVIPKVSGYDEVYRDPKVDLIYVGLPHSMHKEACIKALNNGKNVLCEKVFMINSKEAKQVYELAESKGLFVMEGMWTRFNPVVHEIQKHLFVNKTIGDVYRLFVDISFDANLPNLGMESRMKNPQFGAGALLDVGVYLLTYARLFMNTKTIDGKPRKFEYQSLQSVFEGIDYMSSVIMKYEADSKTGISPQCVLTSSFYSTGAPPFLRIEGAKGFIEAWGSNRASPRKFKISFHDEAQESIEFELDHPGRGFYWEADAVADCISQGKLECDLHSKEENMLIMGILDDIRSKGGVVYPQDLE